MPTPGGSSGYVGGGSAETFCATSPADQAASIDNLVSRVTVLETIVSQLLGVDISTIQLSDISQDMGSILGGSFNGGILADLFIKFGKMNVWAVSGQDTFIQSGGTNGSISAGERIDNSSNIVAFSGAAVTSTSVGNVAGIKSGQSYLRTWDIPNNKGFYFTGRFGFYDANFTINDAVSGLRAFIGLHTANLLVPGGLYNNDSLINAGYADRGIGFQYSTPRGDSTFHFFLLGAPTYLVAGTPTVIDTGMPVLMEHFYDMSIRNEPGASSINWEIRDMTAGTAVSGAVSTPEVYHGGLAPNDARNNAYAAQAAVWNNQATKFKTMLIQHIWSQSIDVDTV